jgi:cellulose synthase/poly-beta-1,6-N-acetylglucosamine synthase-like glycosyltransferase
MILVLSLLIAIPYYALIISFIFGFDMIKPFKSPKKESENRFSIIIPFRNEERSLPTLLKSIEELDYPKELFEIIFVDDSSEDDSVDIINEFINKRPFDSHQGDIHIINNNRKTGSPKKDAINTAIDTAHFDWIITTDADCTFPKNWLLSFDAFIQKNKPKLIVAPVTYMSNNRFFEQFQLLDFLSLQGSTIGGFGIKKPFLCNGANLCYSKQAFNEVSGFDGNSSIASGDDIFLLEKINTKYPNKVHYLKTIEVIVKTEPQHSFKELVNQRVRWAAKSTSYNNPFGKFVSLSVFAMNALLIVLLLTSILGYNSWQLLLFLFVLKFLVDLILIFKTATFFKQLNILKNFSLSSLLYPFFIMFVIIVSLKSRYTWKGRQFKK